MSKYNPALLVGCGGTGIKTLRFLQGNPGDDAGLRDFLERGAIQLVGLDTDPKVNSGPVNVDHKLLHQWGIPLERQEKAPTRLEVLDNFVLLDRQRINNALPMVSEDTRRKREEELLADDAIRLPHVASWFPRPDLEGRSLITGGQSKHAGAAQWRPLGRLGLFLAFENVWNQLNISLMRLRTIPQYKDPGQVFVVSSLAGGTGSGIFWDVIFILRMIDPNLTINGAFVLDDPYSSVDRTGRIAPNVYGALKEIVTLKNARVKESFIIDYPMNKRFVVKPGGQPVLDSVYLYQAFPPGEEVDDVRDATIDATAFRLSRNLLAMLSQDLHVHLDVGRNNEGGDTTSTVVSQESRFVFSTTSMADFPRWTARDFEDYFLPCWLQGLIKTIEQETGGCVAEEMAWRQLEVVAPADGSGDPLTCAVNDILGDDRQQRVKLYGDFQSMLEEGIRALSASDAVQKTHVELNEILVRAYPEAVREAIVATLMKTHDRNTVQVDVGALAASLRQHVEQLLTRLDKRVKELEAAVRKEKKPLSGQMLELVEKMEKGLAAVAPDRKSNRHGKIEIALPMAIHFWKDIFQDKELSDESHLLARADQLIDRDYKREMFLELLRNQKTLLDGAALGSLMREILEERWVALRPGMLQALAKVREADREFRRWEKYNQQLLKELRQQLDKVKEENGVARKPPDTRWKELFGFLEPVRISNHHRKGLLEKIGKFNIEINRNGDDPAQEVPPIHFEEVSPETVLDALMELGEKKSDESLLAIMEHFLPSREKWAEKKISTQLMVLGGRYLLQQMATFLGKTAFLAEAGDKAKSDALDDLISQCRTHVFVKGVLEPTIQKEKLVILPPRVLLAEDREDVVKKFGLASMNALGVVPYVEQPSDGASFIFFEDLYHPADEIAKILSYHFSYANKPPEERALHHFDRRAVEFEEIVRHRVSMDPVFCGNHGCSHDIRLLSRKEVVCPKCDGPIWNRCGNETCLADHLLLQLGRENSTPPFHCPTCRQELLSWWWRCKKHPSHPIPMDKVRCPLCIEEHRKNLRPLGEISPRPGVQWKECPGCRSLAEKKQGIQPKKVAARFLPFYEKGVNGHDSLTFAKSIVKEGVNPHFCAERSTEHYLFPTCPLSTSTSMHHLYRNEDKHFVCGDHPGLRFHVCRVCDYPILVDEALLRGDPVRCPRCLISLRHCRYCGSRREMVMDQPSPNQWPPRCPECTNLFRQYPNADYAGKGLEDPAYCRNLFGCDASRSIWQTTANYDLGKCRSCDEEKATLLDWRFLNDYVKDCPFCLMLVGEKGKNALLNANDCKDLKTGFSQTGMPRYKVCPVCGTVKSRVFLWMMSEERGDCSNEGPAWVKDHAGAFNAPDSLKFWDAIEIFRLLRRADDDRKVYRALLKDKGFGPGWCRQGVDKVVFGEELLSIFQDQEGIVASQLRKRLDVLAQYSRDKTDREDKVTDEKTVHTGTEDKAEEGGGKK